MLKSIRRNLHIRESFFTSSWAIARTQPSKNIRFARGQNHRVLSECRSHIVINRQDQTGWNAKHMKRGIYPVWKSWVVKNTSEKLALWKMNEIEKTSVRTWKTSRCSAILHPCGPIKCMVGNYAPSMGFADDHKCPRTTSLERQDLGIPERWDYDSHRLKPRP